MRRPLMLFAVLLSIGLVGLGSVLVFLRRAEVQIAQVFRSAAPNEEHSTWIGSVSVFDGERLLRDQDVLLRGATVVSVTAAGGQTPPTGALRIDGRGRTLLPGLIDSHAHLLTAGAPPWATFLPKTDSNARAMLYAGVTSVLVAQSGPDEDRLLRKSEHGSSAVPHLFVAGPGLTAPGGHPIPFVRALLPWPLSSCVTARQPTAATAQEARTQVARIWGMHHPPLCKIFFDALPKGAPQLSREVLRSAIKEARDVGMRPIVHIGSSADMVIAAEEGAALLMHPPSKDVLSDEQVATLARIKIPFVTTLRTLLASDEVGRTGGTQLEREIMDARLIESFAHKPPGFAIRGFEQLETEFPQAAARMRENIQRLTRAGVPFFVGTDAGVFGVFPGASLHGEIRELEKAGLSPQDILRAATRAPAAFLDPSRSFGQVAAGQRADLLLVRGDPLSDLGALSAMEEVWLSGVRLTRRPVSAQ